MLIDRRTFWQRAGLALVASPLAARGKKGKSGRHGGSGAIDIDVVIGDHRRIIGEYLGERPTDRLPPGLAKRGGALPPGLEKQLQRNGSLPPGLQKRITPYPPDLARRLPPLGPDYRGGFLNGHVVIYNRRTSVIVDAFIP